VGNYRHQLISSELRRLQLGGRSLELSTRERFAPVQLAELMRSILQALFELFRVLLQPLLIDCQFSTQSPPFDRMAQGTNEVVSIDWFLHYSRTRHRAVPDGQVRVRAWPVISSVGVSGEASQAAA
jgi:hypothetical protein